eukprot:766655-Hanusia_phi.AAC.7
MEQEEGRWGRQERVEGVARRRESLRAGRAGTGDEEDEAAGGGSRPQAGHGNRTEHHRPVGGIRGSS